jgi:hypothetical protein
MVLVSPSSIALRNQERIFPMIDQQERILLPTPAPAAEEAPPLAVEPQHTSSNNGVVEERWQARAGREGARRVHQLIQEGRLYEKEHGLKRGRQRLRQLIELGKLYEQEHGLRPVRANKHGQRLSRMGRQQLVATLLQCLLRLAKPSFRSELTRLVEALDQETNGHAA